MGDRETKTTQYLFQAPRRTVTKEGPNRGREFFCCPKQRESQCGFFQWSDEVVLGQEQQETTFNCDCGQPAARRKVQKEGANKGREFYCCAKPRDADNQCRYFQWLDEVDVGGGGGGVAAASGSWSGSIVKSIIVPVGQL